MKKITTSRPEATILSAVTKYEEFVAPTYGPAGKRILIVRSEFNHEAVDDGRRSSEAFELDDELENGVIQYVKETTQKGKDGTTTAAIVMSSLVKQSFEGHDDMFARKNRHEIASGLRKGLGEAVTQIKDMAKPIKTRKELQAIAFNSYNDDKVAKMIAELVHDTGKDGIITVEDSRGTDTVTERVAGFEIPKGFLSPYLTNDGEKAEAEDVAVLVIPRKINLFAEVGVLLQELVVKSGKKQFAIFAEGFGDDMINKCVGYKVMGHFTPILVELPAVGDKNAHASDIAAVTGATVIDGKVVRLEEAKAEHAGHADKIRSTREKTTVIGGSGKTKDHVASLAALKENTENAFEKDALERRIAAVLGGIAVVKVGAYTENEQKAVKAKVENAVAAAQIAFRGGVVPGAGKSMSSVKTSSDILNEALKAPRKRLEDNGAEYLDEDAVDPAEVVITAIEAAVSVATGLITMGGIVVPERKRDKN